MPYTAQIALALRLITAKGTDFTLKHGLPSVDRLTGVVTAAGLTSYTVKAVLLPGITKGSTPEHSQRKILIAGDSCPVDPVPDDVLLSPEGRSWRVLSSIALRPDDDPTAIIYTVQVER